MRNLAAAEDHRGTIRFVASWARFQDPPPMARLAQARAFLALAQVDRAWIRIQDLVQDPEATPDVLALAARIFLARGWSGKAREVLGRALPDAGDDAEIQSLWDQAAHPAQEPAPPSDAALKAAADPAQADALVDLAADHLARGQHLVARGVLERVRQLHPDHARAGDLLWALDGELDEEGSLAELTDRHAPLLLDLGDYVDENTESITQETLRDVGEPEDSSSHAFPSLFRGPTTDALLEDDDWTDEVTQTVRHQPGPQALDQVDTLPSEQGFDEEGDTRIVRVRGRDGTPESLHHGVDLVEGFDLQAYRREMGMSGFDPSLEEEDDELVVLTGRERPTPRADLEQADPTQSQIGREVAHLMSARPNKQVRKPPGIPEEDETGSGESAPGTPPVSMPATPPREPDATSEEPGARGPLWPWLVVLGAVGIVAVGTPVVLLMVWLLR